MKNLMEDHASWIRWTSPLSDADVAQGGCFSRSHIHKLAHDHADDVWI